jgi:hypothetical protein
MIVTMWTWFGTGGNDIAMTMAMTNQLPRRNPDPHSLKRRSSQGTIVERRKAVADVGIGEKRAGQRCSSAIQNADGKQVARF